VGGLEKFGKVVDPDNVAGVVFPDGWSGFL
jgi:hypothetical protein